MNRLRVGLVIILFALVWGGSAEAANWGMAGCGLGAVVFKDKPGKIQIVAATTNNIVSPQTSAITSGTSNCFEEDSKEEAKLYINLNQEALKKDIARGQGETLQGLSQILQCEDCEVLGSTLQTSYLTIFPSSTTSVEEISSSIETLIHSNEALSRSCKI